ncbi:EAL domain-containing protein [Pseudoalteromonas rubra]|uniref:cyclic-guanylate-specific phosphodiesterase n=1 Tax=Pseudoalteromonas rubra TaxID=43658 RepID=A0A5S3WLW9_9GAMM|nr:EAL domain-containing protein [Pseudoalteromonas rubra]TMP34908.1 EAL domain-containing protein [Pseudoalteromonas rubra]
MTQGNHSLTDRIKNIIVAWLISSLLFGLLAIFVYVQQKDAAKQSVQAASELIRLELDSQLHNIDVFLKQAEQLNTHCDANTIALMREQVFVNPALSEIGIVDQQGRLLCNSFGRLTPPVQTTEPVKQSGLRYHGPIITDFLQVPAFVLARTRSDGFEVNALLPTSWLSDTLDITRHRNLAFIALLDGDSGVPIFLRGKYTLPLGEALFPMRDMVEFEGRFDDGTQKYIFARPLAALPQLTIMVASDAKQLSTIQPVWLLTLLLLYSASLIGLTMLLNYYDRRVLSSRALLLGAISRHELFNVYQPLVDATTRELVGVEVLVRWQHPVEGELSPAYFIPEAERDGSILDLSIYQIEKALTELSEIVQNHPNFKVSFNVNGYLLTCKDYLEVLHKANLVIPRLTIELTERDVLSQAQIHSVLQSLVEQGVEIAIDDFGTGYSGLHYLQSFPIDLLKIDQTFVASIGMENLQSPVLNAVIEMAAKLDKKLIAEGVETAHQAEYLSRQGVSVHQGWYYYKAMPVHELKQIC